MNVKRFLGANAAECMVQVRNELGADAFILTERTVRKKGIKGLFSKPMVEIVAAYEPEEAKPKKARYPAGNIPILPLTRETPDQFPPPESAFRPRPVQGGPAAFAPAKTPPARPSPRSAPETLTEEEAQAAALQVLERLARDTAPAPKRNSAAPPPAPASISAYSPRAVRRDAPSEPAEEDSFRPISIRRVERDTGTESVAEEKLINLENKLDALSTTLTSLVSKVSVTKDGARGGMPAELDAFLLSLLESDVHEEFALKLIREAAEIMRRQEDADAREVMEQLLRQTIGEPMPLKLKKFKRSVVMLVGPTGVGKTTTLAKLAAIFMLNHHAKVGVITTDTFRIAAVEQLKTYAEILEIPVSVVYDPDEIADALREHENKDVVLIDTAGKSPNDKSLEAEITRLIKNSDCDEVHLVLSATTGFTGLLNILNTYSFLRDYKLLFTKLDETPSWGILLNAKFLTDKPISYLAMGQTVPDDIEVMIPRKILDRLLPAEGG